MVSTRFVSLHLLRLSLPVLSIILIYNICHCPFHELFRRREVEEVVDVSEMTVLNERVARLLRLHELLARPQIECEKTLRGKDPEDFFLCSSSSGEVNSALVVSLSSLWKGHFEVSLTAVHTWHVITVSEETFTHRLNNNKTVERGEKLEKWKEWSMPSVEGKIDIAILNLYGGPLRPDHSVIDTLLTGSAPRIAVIVARVRNEVEADMWHVLLNHLFYRNHYALIGATSSGICGRTIQSCEYRLSLIRFDPLEDNVLPPPYNLGSPLEERHRLLSFVRASTVLCEALIHSSLPSFCTSSLHDNSTALLLSYLPYPVLPDLSPLHPSNLFIASPHPSVSTSTSLSMAVSPDGLNGTSNEGWPLRPLSFILQQVPLDLSLLLVDLESVEWDLIHDIATQLIQRRIAQLAITVRLFVEEDETIRRFFWNLRRLQIAGYKMTTVSTEATRMRLILMKDYT